VYTVFSRDDIVQGSCNAEPVFYNKKENKITESVKLTPFWSSVCTAESVKSISSLAYLTRCKIKNGSKCRAATCGVQNLLRKINELTTPSYRYDPFFTIHVLLGLMNFLSALTRKIKRCVFQFLSSKIARILLKMCRIFKLYILE